MLKKNSHLKVSKSILRILHRLTFSLIKIKGNKTPPIIQCTLINSRFPVLSLLLKWTLNKKQPIAVETKFPFCVGSSSCRRKTTNSNRVCCHSSAPGKPPHHSYSHLIQIHLFVGGTHRAVLKDLPHPPPFSQLLVMTKHVKCF